MNFLKLLKHSQEDFPNISTSRLRFVFVISTGVFIAIFLNIFQPFTIRNMDGNLVFALIISGYGLVVSLILYFNEFVVRKWFPRFFESSNWTIAKTFIWLNWQLFSVSFGIYAYRTYWCCGWEAILEFQLYPQMLMRTISIGIFPLAGILIYTYIQQIKNGHSKNINATLRPSTVRLSSEYQQETLLLKPDQLLYISSADNYVAIHFYNQDGLQKKLLRTTLSKTEKELVDFPNLQRCHRSYIVNINQIEGVKGNSKRLELSLRQVSYGIPVSKSYIPKLRLHLEAPRMHQSPQLNGELS